MRIALILKNNIFVCTKTHAMMECRILIHFVYVVCCLVVLRACLALQDLDGCGSKRRRHDASTVAALMWKIPPYEAGDSGVGCDASDQEHLCPDLELEVISEGLVCVQGAPVSEQLHYTRM